MERYPEDTQTLHAELFALLLAQRGRAEWPQLAGTFTTKTIAGTDYVYFAYSDPGSGKRQFAVGRHSPQVERLIDAYRTAREGLVADEQQLRRLAALLRTAGVPAVPHGVARVLRALADAGVPKEEVGIVNAHATSTPLGDVAEVKAMKKVFGSHLEKLQVHATKSMTGHLLGGASAIEAIDLVMTLNSGKVHPTLNVENQDPECPVNCVPGKASTTSARFGISNSFGFGGHNSVVVIEKGEA